MRVTCREEREESLRRREESRLQAETREAVVACVSETLLGKMMAVRLGKKAESAEAKFEAILDGVRQFAVGLPGEPSVGVAVKCQWMPENRNEAALRRERAAMANYALRKSLRRRKGKQERGLRLSKKSSCCVRRVFSQQRHRQAPRADCPQSEDVDSDEDASLPQLPGEAPSAFSPSHSARRHCPVERRALRVDKLSLKSCCDHRQSILNAF